MTMTMPEDFENGVKGLMDQVAQNYDDVVLRPLGERQTSAIKLQAGDGEGDAAMALKYGYSAPITQHARISKKLYGYMRDSNVSDPLQQAAIRGSNALSDFFFDAPCVNREGRYAIEESRAGQWLSLMKESPRKADDDTPDVDDLLHKWSTADALMLQVRIVEEQDGIEAAEPYYEEFLTRKAERDEVRMEAAKLPGAENMYFWCRLQQIKIMRERTYDLAMGYPSIDYTDVKKEIADGGDIHDLIHRMPWPFREAYHLAMSTMLDGEAHRMTLIAMLAGQIPTQMPQGSPYGMYPPPWMGRAGMMNGEEEGEDGEEAPDKRKALINLPSWGKKKPESQEPKPLRRRSRGNRR